MVLATENGGKGLVEQYQKAVEKAGIQVRYETAVTSLILRDGRVCGVNINNGQTMLAKAVVLCTGGFEASSRLRAQYLGPSWDLGDFIDQLRSIQVADVSSTRSRNSLQHW